MRKRVSKVLFTGGLAALVVGLAATSSSAVTLVTWSVSPGGSITLTGGKATLKDSATSWALHCQSSSGTGSLKSGSDLPGNGLGSIKTLTFATCTGPAKAAYTVTATLPWSLNATAYNSTKGVTTLMLEGVDITFSSTGCSGTLDGTGASAKDGVIKSHYTNSTGDLRTDAAGATLKLYNVTGCTGLFQSGDAFTFTTTWTLSKVQTITGAKVTGRQ